MKDKYINVQIPILDDVNGMEIVKTFTEEQLWYVCAIAKAFEELQTENQQLKQQLEEKDRIIKKTKKIIKNRINDISKLKIKLYPKGYYELLEILNIDKGE